MQPPICEVCDERFDPGDGGQLITFVETDEGREFSSRGVPGHSPDQGWFCERHAAAAAAVASSRTRGEALEEIPTPGIAVPEAATPETATPETATPETATPDTATPETATPETDRAERDVLPSDPAESGEHADAELEARKAEFRARFELRRATKVSHELGRRVRRDSVAQRFRQAAEAAADRLEMAEIDPDERRDTTSAPGPEPREPLGTTTRSFQLRWALGEHEVRFSDRDTHWDSWAGVPGGGARFQGTIMLAVDDTRLFATYADDGIVTTLSESGVRTPESSDIIDDLIEGLRSPS